MLIKIDTSTLSPTQSEQVAIARDRCARAIVGPPTALPPNATLQIEVAAALLGNGEIAISKPRTYWGGTGFIAKARIRIEKMKIAALETDDRLIDVVAHEMIHCLGFGLSWSSFPGLVTDEGGAEFAYHGANALAEYRELLRKAGKPVSATFVPVEKEGGAAQSAMHWREAVFGKELMTTKQGWGERAPLSRVTIAAMKDLGYKVDLDQADDYRL